MGLFSRKRDGGSAAVTRLYYASDIHGSEVLWRKFLNAAQAYRADVLVMGGDLTGKVVIPKGTTLKQTDLQLEAMNYLVEGVIGSIPKS